MNLETRLKFFAVTLGALFTCLIVFVKVVNTKTTLIKPSYEISLVSAALVPEAWGFFTRNPRFGDVETYRYTSVGIERIDMIKLRNYFSLNFSRWPRIVARESGRIQEAASKFPWAACEGDPIECLKKSETHQIENPKNDPYICGKIGMVIRDRLPWSWRNSQTKMPSRVINIEVNCT